MVEKIKKIKYKDESFLLPCPIYIDLEELEKKFYESEDLFAFLLAKSISEWTKKMGNKDDPCRKKVEENATN